MRRTNKRFDAGHRGKPMEQFSSIINHRRRRPLDPRTLPLGPAPARLNADQKALWDYAVHFTPPGLLRKSNRKFFELTVRLWLKSLDGSGAPEELTRLARNLTPLGLIPDDYNARAILAALGGPLC
jgi:hypothetical protein